MIFDLRPQTLKDIIGQKRAKLYLDTLINASSKSEAQFPHILFLGPSGIGKTTLAQVIAKETGLTLKIANGASISHARFLAPYLTKAEPNSLLFIDEIHRLPKSVQEFLFPVLEENKIRLSTENSTINLDIGPISILGATTDLGLLLEPTRNRFHAHIILERYSLDELKEIADKNSSDLNIKFESNSLTSLCQRCKDIPRVLNNHLLWLSNYCLANNLHSVDSNALDDAMSILGIDENGLNQDDQSYLDLLSEQYGSPLSLSSISATLNISKDTILHSIEPFLLQKRLIKKTSAGRVKVKYEKIL